MNMTAEATYFADPDVIQETTPAAGYASGEVIQLADGRAGYVAAARALVSGDPAGLQTKGIVTLAKTASVVCVKGCPAYWDRSAGTCTPLLALTGGDFLIGTFADDAASSDTTCQVILNERPSYQIDLLRDTSTTVVVGTTPTLTVLPGQVKLLLTSTNEAQKIDMLSDKSWLTTQPFILEGRINIVTNGDGNVDINVGVADDTHASDADSIVTSCFLHVNGNELHLYAESDNVTAEVAATDTTVDYAEATAFDFVMDARTPSDIQIYINGVLVLSGSTFTIAGATGPIKLLVHLEKSTGSETPQVNVEKMAIRFMDVTT
jgi:predicted RecA/RadA family phage recombinase